MSIVIHDVRPHRVHKGREKIMKRTTRTGLLVSIALLLTAPTAFAACGAAPDSLNFGSSIVHVDKVMTLTLTNDAPMDVTGILTIAPTAYNPFSFDGGMSFHNYDLGPGETLDVNVHCSPDFHGMWETNIELGAIGSGCERSFVPIYTYGQPVPNTGTPVCGSSPSRQLLFPPTVVGGESVLPITLRNQGTDLNNGAGVFEGDMQKDFGEFFIPWGGPYGVTYYQKWNVYWRPETPGWTNVILDLPNDCERYGPMEMRGLALVDGVACGLSTTDLTLNPVAVGETAYGTVTIQNMGDEILSLVVPGECGPFSIVNTPYHRTLAPAEGLQLNIEFTPTEPGLQTCDLDLGAAACETVRLTGLGLEDDGVTDRIGIWFEQSGTTDRHDTTTPFEEVTAYLMILNPSVEWGALGWECCVEMVGDGMGFSWELAGSAINIETPPCFSVGRNSGPLLGQHVIVLATLTFVQPDPDSPTYFYVHPVASPSLPGVPVYADGADEGRLIPLAPASGSETMPVAVVNEVVTDVPEVPGRTALVDARPNPFNPSTTLSFELARESVARLAIHDMRGRLVRTLVDGGLQAGAHQSVWDGRDASGRTVESGVYFARLTAGDEHRMLKVMLLK